MTQNLAYIIFSEFSPRWFDLRPVKKNKWIFPFSVKVSKKLQLSRIVTNAANLLIKKSGSLKTDGILENVGNGRYSRKCRKRTIF